MEEWTSRKDQDGVKETGANNKEDDTRVKDAEVGWEVKTLSCRRIVIGCQSKHHTI